VVVHSSTEPIGRRRCHRQWDTYSNFVNLEDLSIQSPKTLIWVWCLRCTSESQTKKERKKSLLHLNFSHSIMDAAARILVVVVDFDRGRRRARSGVFLVVAKTNVTTSSLQAPAWQIPVPSGRRARRTHPDIHIGQWCACMQVGASFPGTYNSISWGLVGMLRCPFVFFTAMI